MSRSLAKITRLGILSREIRNDYGSLQQLLERTRQNCNAVIAETILLGTKLGEAKRLVGYGNWLEWLAKNCPEISDSTARRYMRLANQSDLTDLKTHKSLHQAYIAIGILPTNDERKPMPAVKVSEPVKQIEAAGHDANANTVWPIVEATVVEQPMIAHEPAVAETSVTRVKSKVGDLIQCLKPLDAPCRKRVAVHLKPLVIFYHRFGK